MSPSETEVSRLDHRLSRLGPTALLLALGVAELEMASSLADLLEACCSQRSYRVLS